MLRWDSFKFEKVDIVFLPYNFAVRSFVVVYTVVTSEQELKRRIFQVFVFLIISDKRGNAEEMK